MIVKAFELDHPIRHDCCKYTYNICNSIKIDGGHIALSDTLRRKHGNLETVMASSMDPMDCIC